MNLNLNQQLSAQTVHIYTYICTVPPCSPLVVLPRVNFAGGKEEGTHTHIRLTALFPGLPGWAGTRKVKPIWILLKQEIVSASGISWAICKAAPHSRQITTPAPHYSVFYRPDALTWRPTNSVKALKAVERGRNRTKKDKGRGKGRGDIRREWRQLTFRHCSQVC